jgi:hypothetical protein
MIPHIRFFVSGFYRTIGLVKETLPLCIFLIDIVKAELPHVVAYRSSQNILFIQPSF